MPSLVVGQHEFVLTTLGIAEGVRLPFPIDVSDATDCTIQVSLHSGGYGGGVLTVRQSNDGLGFDALPTPVTMNADGIETFDASKLRFIDVVETTAITADSRIIVRIEVRATT